MLGTKAVSRLLDSFGGASPGEEAIEQQLQAGRSVIPQLQAQALGMPSAATQAAGANVNEAVNRAMQSYGASQRRQTGTVQTTPARAQLGRLQAAGVRGIADVRGQAQIFLLTA